MQIRRGIGHATECGRINARERTTKTIAGTGLDSADVVQPAPGAVREIRPRMAGEALKIDKMLASVLPGRRRGSVALAIMAFGIFV